MGVVCAGGRVEEFRCTHGQVTRVSYESELGSVLFLSETPAKEKSYMNNNSKVLVTYVKGYCFDLGERDRSEEFKIRNRRV